MLLKFSDIVNKWGVPKGIIHIGAHILEEREEYLRHGCTNTIWIEANPHLFPRLLSQLSGTAEKVFSYAICDKSNQMSNFKITNNNESSSILDLDKHKIHHPHIHIVAETEVETKRIDDLFLENNLDIDAYDFVNLDIQGAELLALNGFGVLLKKIKFIYTEVNKAYLYKSCALVEEIDEYLKKFGFERVETVWTEFEWGDALYKKTIEND